VELGYKNLDLDFWHILFAPAGTPLGAQPLTRN